MIQNLNKYVDVKENNMGGILKWIRHADQQQGGFAVPACFSIEKMLQDLHSNPNDKVYVQQEATGALADVVDTTTNLTEYTYIFVKNKETQITLN